MIDLNHPSLYINRELSGLAFNRRVLEQARDPSTPLLERLRFLTIFSTNLDEFFEVRVSSVKEQAVHTLPQLGPDGMTPGVLLKAISTTAHELVREHYTLLHEQILPRLAQEGAPLLKLGTWTQAQTRWLEEYFTREVLPVVTPIGLDPAHPFPNIQNKSLALIVKLEGADAFGRTSDIAVVQVPRSLPRVVLLPPEVGDAPWAFALLGAVVTAFVGKLFPGMEIKGAWQFRVTRNSELWVQEEEVDDLLDALKGELRSRNYGDAVRLELTESCPQDVADLLLSEYGLTQEDLYRVDGPVNLGRLAAVYDLVARPDLKYPPFVPGPKRLLKPSVDYFSELRRTDILLHHPFETFLPVLDIVRQAAADPHVVAVKMTLYRTGSESPIVEALLEAARANKEVTVVVELRARFDEAANIDLATRLQEAGATVVYGVVDYKTHAKMLLIVRREEGRLKRYVHLGTGNYHSRTTQFYTDFSYLTCDDDIGEDVHHLFMQLTGLGRVVPLKRLHQSPFTLEDAVVDLIDAEARAAHAGEPARIVAKMNSLSEVRVIQALYRASQAGVSIDLIVRGICCLRAGIPGVSDNIRVRSIVGRFLEHHRIFHFHAGGEGKVFCSSADWMARNLLRRVETAFPIQPPALRARVIHEGLETYLADNSQAWLLLPGGEWVRPRLRAGVEVRRAQEILLSLLATSPPSAPPLPLEDAPPLPEGQPG